MSIPAPHFLRASCCQVQLVGYFDYTGPMDDDSGVDEQCLELARYALSDPRWTDGDRVNLAHALQQTVEDFITEFWSDKPKLLQ